MSAPLRVLRFLVRAALLYAVFLGLWRILAPGYAVLFRTGGGLAIALLGLEGVAKLQPSPLGLKEDTVLSVDSADCTVTWFAAADSWFTAYLPTAGFLALALASDLALSRKLRALCWGSLWVHGYVAVRLAALALEAWTLHVKQCGGDHAGFFTGAGFALAAGTASDLLYGEPLVYSLVPVAIWLAVCCRRSDLRDLAFPGPDSAGNARESRTRDRTRGPSYRRS